MSEEDGNFQPGEKIGDYEVVSTLGFGATGTVYLAQHTVLKKLFAVKVLSGELAFMPEFVRVFQHEAQIVAALNHENIVSVHNFGECNGFYYYVMDFVNGGTLEDLRRRNGGRLRPADAVSLIISAARGLAYAHRYGVVHRDLKPENILLTRSGVPQITDFGMAHVDLRSVAGRQHGNAPSAGTPPAAATFRRAPATPLPGRRPAPSRTQIFIEENARDKPEVEGGTEGYIAPEVSRGNAATPRADVYALGALLHFLLVGETPPEPGRISPEIHQVVNNRELLKVLNRALSVAPQRRYPTAQEFLDALLRVESAPARWRRKILYVATGLAVAIAFGVVFALGERSQKEKTEHRVAKIIEAERGRAEDFSRERSRSHHVADVLETLQDSILKTHSTFPSSTSEKEQNGEAASVPAAGVAEAAGRASASSEQTETAGAREYWEQLYSEKFGVKRVSFAVSSGDFGEKISSENSIAFFRTVPQGTYNIYLRASEDAPEIEAPVRISVGGDQVSRVVKIGAQTAGTLPVFFSTIDVSSAADIVRVEIPVPVGEETLEVALSEIELRPTFSNADFSRLFGEFLSAFSEK